MIRDKLAQYAHTAWSGWMKYLFSKCVPLRDGSIAIPVEFVKRWKRQMHTDYANLPAQEQKSDLDEADKILKIVTENWFKDKND